ncbi:MAG TPA: DegT/DnrJ/EryC1/StrS family aminotransferase [Gaiellaceae bacterium]|nr:DegT/DnrJ/EryC1/StrS family aminotransferase [Gaiellaceae bacterium]
MSEHSRIEVPYVDLAAQQVPLRSELLAAVARVLDHGHFILGPEVEAFEEQFAELCGTRFAVGVASGTDALVLALRALDIASGDEVITVPNSFVASAAAIALVGARPVFVDVGDDMNIDPEAIGPAVTPRTRAILPVHLTGRPAAMQRVLEVAARHGLAVVEDCAQAVLAELGGRRVGSFGAVGCFSLHPLKTLGAAGDAGVLTTDDEDLANRFRLLRNIGLATRDDATVWSGNSRLDTLHAAMLLVKLQYLAKWTEARRQNAAAYVEALTGASGLRLPVEKPGERAVYHTFVLRSEVRNELRTHLRSAGIGTAIHYPVPIHLQSIGHTLGYGPGDFPVAERQATEILSIPVHHNLTAAQREFVVEGIRDFVPARAATRAGAR